MYGVALRFLRDPFEAEEAMQEGFIKAFSNLHQYKGEVTFGAWLKRIVINRCIDGLKSRKLELIALSENVLLPVEEEADWEVADGLGVEDVKEAVGLLQEKYRYPLMLFLFEGYDHQEISEILGISEVASRTLVHRGKKKLQEHLKIKRNGTGS